MFTGIVEEIGRVAEAIRTDGLLRLTILGILAHEGAEIGDSIAVNGVCLTIVARRDAALSFEVVPETLRLTNLGGLAKGSPVNLERAVRSDRPMGGHYVQGHVDGRLTLRSSQPDGDALTVWFDAPTSMLSYLVSKGFVTVDGASLTVVDVDERGFSVTLVPHTRGSVVFGEAEVGYRANLEVDVMAKYVERMLSPRLAAIEERLAAIESGRDD